MITWLNAKIIDKKMWAEDLISLRLKTEPLDFAAGQFVVIGLEHNDAIISRPYSLVNSPDDDYLEIHFNKVDDGEFSTLLTALEPDDPILVSNRPSGLLTLDETPDASELWLFATGTGIGPFISLLKTAGPWQRFEKIVVGYSVKSLDDMAYRDEFEAMKLRHPEQFVFIPFVTREKVSGTIHSRLTDFIQSGELEQLVRLSFSPKNSHIMLCGNATMLDDVITILEQKGLRRHSRREPGHIAIEKYF